ncbi:MAG TPA: DEAD/DEAH box helicase [Pseudomonadales bacterium]
MGRKPPPGDVDALAPFEDGIRRWFIESLGEPTDIQAQAWPSIAAGEHVLATAPTGSGKTLTAFLWALNQFAAGRWRTGATRVVYVSPLKALNNDIRQNLLGPLGELEARGVLSGVRVQTRSGDTPQSERQRMLRRPPEILITTPESLALLLTTTRGRHALATVRTVIVDEVHALADNRRGTLVLTALERIVELAGEVQRIALSATVRPLDAIAAHVAGYDDAGRPRPIRILEGGGTKAISLRVCFPEAARRAVDSGTKIWDAMGERFREIIAANRATLFFTNSRRLAERIAAAINRDQPEPLAYAHHGSLSREIRLEVEGRLKRGELKAIVATSSLEMGIDIGELDEVVMVQSPPSVAATLQRIGRAGHRVGEESRGSLFPAFAADFVAAAALADAVEERDIEPLQPLENPLDVLCQIVVSTTATEPWSTDRLYALLRRSGPYHALPRAHFDLVLEMLAGRYAGTRVRELAARISYDRIRSVVQAQHGAVLAMYASGGVIPDRGYYQIRHIETGTVIGELDEEYVWEARVGDVFSLGTQNWQIHRITHNDVVVRPAPSGSLAAPFWRADGRGRSFHYSRRILDFLEQAERRLAAGQRDALEAELTAGRGFDAVASEELVAYLTRQREAVDAPLPHRRHLLVERILTGPGGYRGPDHVEQIVFHTGWGRRVNRPWALALAAALERRGTVPELYVDDDAVAVQTREPLDPEELLGLVGVGNLEPLLRASLESSGFFGARFREAAGRALLLTRQRFNARQPLWMSRLQAKKLLGAVRELPDFPVLLETWRTCLADEFDLPALQECLAGLADGSTTVSLRVTDAPSPFAANLSFGQINRYMYATDEPEQRGMSALSDELIKSAVHDEALRPRIEPATLAAFEAKRQRTAPGYAPESPDEWAEWIKERVLLPEAEAPPELAHPDLARLALGDRSWLVHRELLGALTGSGLAAGAVFDGPVPEVADPRSAEQLALEMLSFYGPLRGQRIRELLPRVPEGLLDDDEALVRGALLAGDEATYYCDADNFEALLRLQRSLRRPQIEARAADELPGFVAAWQGIGSDGLELDAALEALRGYEAPVGVWLHDLPAARRPNADDHELDRTLEELGWLWQGVGRERVRLGYPEDLELLQEAPPAADPALASLFADPSARYPFLQLADRQSDPLAAFNERWWQAVWDGVVSADSLAPLRQGVRRSFRLGSLEPARPRTVGRPGHRRMLRRARAGFGEAWGGAWFLLPAAAAERDALLELEDAKERVRLLLDRYGLACRELANREGGTLRWSRLFRALRVMELAGELVAGYFFAGLSGPQFAPPAALTLLQSERPAPRHFWCNALDPISPCGLGLDWPELPQRRPQNYLAFLDGRLALVAENMGRRLTFHVEPAACDRDGVLAPLVFLLERERRLEVETINGEPPSTSPYRPALETVGRLVSDHRGSYLERA